MKKGITSTLAFELEIQVSDVEQVIFTFKEKVNSEEYLLQKEYPSESVIFEDNKFKCKLTQEETDSLTNTFFVEAQINLSNKSVIKSDICKKIMPPTLWTTFVEDNESSGEEEIINLTFTDYVEGGGSGGSSNYNDLTNKPKINNIELIGNKTTSDLGLDIEAGDGLKRENNTMSVDLASINNLAKFYNGKLIVRPSDIGLNDYIRQALTQSGIQGEYPNPLASKQYVDNLMSGATKWEFVSQLPTENIDIHTIYFVPKESAETDNIYDEWVYAIQSRNPDVYDWELLGTNEVDLSNYDTSAQVDTKITNKTNKIWNAVYRNGEMSRQLSDYDGIKVNDLIIDFEHTRKIYKVFILFSGGFATKEMSNVYAISGTPPTVSTDVQDGEIYFKDCVYFSDNGNIYYCTDRDDSQAPDQFTFTWQTYKGTDTTYSASTGLSLNNGAFSVDNPLPSSAQADSGKILSVNSSGNAEWQTKNYEDKTTITTDTSSTTPTLALANNTEQRYTQDLTSLTLTLPQTTPNDFISSVVFASGSTATSMTYDSSIKWSGTDVTSNAFVPQANQEYEIVFWFNGLSVNAVVRGVA